MKTFKLKIKTRNFLLLFLSLMIVTVSCRKSDVVDDPVDPPVNKLSVFKDQLPAIMTATDNNQLWAHLHYQIGKGLYNHTLPGNPGGENPYVKAGELVWDIYKEVKGEPSVTQEYQEISSQLTSLGTQITELQTQMSQLAIQLSIDYNQLKNYMAGLEANAYCTNIEALYSGNSVNSLDYYTAQALLNKQGAPYAVPFATLKANCIGFFIPNVMSTSGGATKNILNIYNAIVPATGLTGSILKTFADNIILDSTVTHNSTVRKASNILTTYQVFENYFTTLINYQFQGLATYANAANAIDSTGNTTRFYVDSKNPSAPGFQLMLENEIAIYLQLVDYIIVNLVDYRNLPQFEADMKYHDFALAPDTLAFNALARSRFVCALYQQAINLPYSPISGAILTPADVSDGTFLPVNNLTVSCNGKSIMATRDLDQSGGTIGIYPYTKWNNATVTASPDHYWNFYSFMDTTMKISSGSSFPISLVDNGNFTQPWHHDAAIDGKVTVKYYNPQNPDPATATSSPTSTNTMAFGFFSARWLWGYQRPSMSTPQNWNRPGAIYWQNFQSQSGYSTPDPALNFTWTDPTKYTLYPAGSEAVPPYVHTMQLAGNISGWGGDYDFFANWALEMDCLFIPMPGSGSSFSMNLFTIIQAYASCSISNTFNAYSGIGYDPGTGCPNSNIASLNPPNNQWVATQLVYPLTVSQTDTTQLLYVSEACNYDGIGGTGSINYQLQWKSQFVYKGYFDIFN